MKILITGAGGQLGRSIEKVSTDFPGNDYIFAGSGDLDIRSEMEVEKFFHHHKPAICINCAAYTAVDKAEEDTTEAFRINEEATTILGRITEKYNCRLIHISTDYVYSGHKAKPYKELDDTNPASVYGKSKLAGEKKIMNLPHVMIIRTSWLYSEFGKNFFKTMLSLMKEKDELNVVFDQTGTPTYASDLAKAILHSISLFKDGIFVPGIYNFSNEGVASWYDFSYEIARISGAKCRINPVESHEFPTPAPRPAYSVLNKSRIKEVYKVEIPHWRQGLEDCYENFKY